MRLPVDNQDFRKIRELGMAYVDKTEQIIRMTEAGTYIFLSRPRRFGKSITVSTLAELYGGDRALFEGLYAYDHWDFEGKRSEVVWLDFASRSLGGDDLKRQLGRMLDDVGMELDFDVPSDYPPGDKLAWIIRKAARRSPSGRAVVLIDEYDKPLVQFLSDMARVKANRDVLRDFYGVLKTLDRHLEFVFLTGVSAFGKVSLFSALNNLRNITLQPVAADLVGITQAELEENFGARLDEWPNSRAEVQRQYNGYCWGGAGTVKVYNPFSIIRYLADGVLANHWAHSGHPKLLTDVLSERGRYDVSGEQATELELLSFDLDQLRTTALLFQTGYLTIVDHDVTTGVYTLDFPNREVRTTFEEVLLEAYVRPDGGSVTRQITGLRAAIEANELDAAIERIDEALASVPYQPYEKQGERFYHAVVFLLFRQVGLAVEAEVSSSRGRADAVLKTDTHIYVFEFKVDRSAAEALAQIEARGYAEAYAGDGREVVRVGVNFDGAGRKVGEWAVG